MMFMRLYTGLVTVVLLAFPAQGAPPVTSKEAPSPGPIQAGRWLQAMAQAPLLEWCDNRMPRSEAVRMLMALQRGEPLGPGKAWYGPSQRRHEWRWLAAQYDSNRDGKITPGEFPDPKDFFTRLDRDRNGVITAEDLDWSEQSPWVRRDADALRLLRAIDGNHDGKISEEQWQAYFKKLAGKKGYVTSEDLREAMAGPKAQIKGVTREVWLQALMAGDLGSPLEGPRVGQEAPDFTLPLHKNKKKVTLSDYRGKKPVVLVFGSFT